MADKTPSDDNATPIPPIVDLTGSGAAADEKPAAKPRKKPEAKVEPAAVPAAVPPVEPAPAAPAAPANPYAAASTPPAAPAAPAAPANPYATPGAPQPYAYGAYAPQPPKGLSIASMILGIAGAVFSLCYGSGFLFGVAGVITGHMASKSQPHAKGMWMTGIITGYVSIGLGLLWVIGLVIFFVAIGSSSMYY